MRFSGTVMFKKPVWGYLISVTWFTEALKGWTPKRIVLQVTEHQYSHLYSVADFFQLSVKWANTQNIQSLVYHYLETVRLTTGGDRQTEGDWKWERRAAVCHSERGLCLWKGGGARTYPSSVLPSLERDTVQIILDVADEGNKGADDQLFKKQRFPKQLSLWACSGYYLTLLRLTNTALRNQHNWCSLCGRSWAQHRSVIKTSMKPKQRLQLMQAKGRGPTRGLKQCRQWKTNGPFNHL